MSALDELTSERNWDEEEQWEDGHALGYCEVTYVGEPVFKEAKAELATLRAQLAEAKDIIIVLAYIDGMLLPEESREFVSVDIRVSNIRKARAWYTKVTTA